MRYSIAVLMLCGLMLGCQNQAAPKATSATQSAKKPAPPAESAPAAQPSVTFEPGQDIVYLGIAKASPLGSLCVQNPTVSPATVYVLDEQYHDRAAGLLGRQVKIQGLLQQATMTVEGKLDVVYFMDKCALLP